MKLNKIFFLLSITLGFAQGAFASGWCHIGSEDPVPPHANFALSVDYQVDFNGGSFVASPVWINLYNPQEGGPIFARVINHYFHGQDVATPFTQLSHESGKFTGQLQGPTIDLGGRTSPRLEVWQTLELRYQNVNGPSQSINLNMSKGFLNQRCFKSP